MPNSEFFTASSRRLFLFWCVRSRFFTSRFWFELVAQPKSTPVRRGLRSHVLFVTILIFLQLIIGATMRHQHAGLSISDFPLAHGQIWPDTSAAAIEHYNAVRMEITNVGPITAFQGRLCR